MFFVFCLCFFSPKRKKRANCRKEQRDERKNWFISLPSKEKAKTYTPKVFDRSSEEAHDAHTLLRAHTS
jgi:hypothetical protein